MTDYPDGVLRDATAPGGIPVYRPVDKDNWDYFSHQSDAMTVEGWVQQMPGVMQHKAYEATSGEYSQYVYIGDTDVRCFIIAGVADDDEGWMFFQEYCGSLFDGNTTPRYGIDQYSEGQPHVLACRRISPTLGQLYWMAA